MKHKLMAAVLVGTMVMSTVGTTTVLAQENDKIELDMWVFGGLSAEWQRILIIHRIRSM